MRFLGYILATIIGLILFSAILFFTLAGIGSSLSADEKVEVKDNSILTINLQGILVEREVEDPFDSFGSLGGLPGTSMIGLFNLKENIKKAATDDKIRGIFINMNVFSAGYSSLAELRAELMRFRETGKFIVVYGEFMTEGSYYLASVANKIYAPEAAIVEFNGLVAEVTFIKKTLEKLGVEPLIFKVGDFKSAVEPFFREDMSEEARLQLELLLDEIYRNNLAEIAASRDLSPEELQALADDLKIGSVKDAVTHGLIDGELYKNQVIDTIKKEMGVGLADDLNTISYKKYKKVKPAGTTSTRDRIAVVIAAGDIITGEGDNASIGSDRFVKALRDIKEDDKIKAVVLRVNSPGGSVLASDLIWNELKEIRKTKPVIASMSDVAASGGYYISMICDTIVAMPNTITGSIGIFGVLFNAEEFLESKLGVTTDRVVTSPHADILTLTHPMDEAELAYMQRNVEKGYDDFTSKAAENRGMTQEDIFKVASGRVWSGTKAQEIGLVDVMGGFDDALNIAAASAELEDYKLKFFPKQKTVLEQLMSELETSARTNVLKQELGPFFPAYNRLSTLQHYEGLQARTFFDLTIK